MLLKYRKNENNLKYSDIVPSPTNNGRHSTKKLTQNMKESHRTVNKI